MKLWFSSVLAGSVTPGVTGITTCRHIHEDGHLARCTTNPTCTHMHCTECGDDLMLRAQIKDLDELPTLVNADVPVGQVVLTRELDTELRRTLASANDPRELSVMTSYLASQQGYSRLALVA